MDSSLSTFPQTSQFSRPSPARIVSQLTPCPPARIVSQLTPCKEKIFELIFGRKPGALGTYCCAQYLVSRRRLQLPKRETYKRMLDMLADREAPKPECGDIPGHSTHCLMYEKLWHVAWGETDTLPIRGENQDLPMFLRARDVENESYLPFGSQYMTTAMSLVSEPIPEEENKEEITA